MGWDDLGPSQRPPFRGLKFGVGGEFVCWGQGAKLQRAL